MLIILEMILILPYTRGRNLPKSRLRYTCGRGEIGEVNHWHSNKEKRLSSEEDNVSMFHDYTNIVKKCVFYMSNNS